MHNRGLDECLIDEAPGVKIEYPREMIPQDGCFSCGHFSITRDNALHMGAKGPRYSQYGICSVISTDEVRFVEERGRPLPAGLKYGYGDRKELYISEIQRIMDSDTDPDAETAWRLYTAIYQNPNRLLKDEVEHIMGPLGIAMTMNPKTVIYYRKSGRLSVSWDARTSSKMDAVKWALIAPPNHPEKMSAVVKFVTENKESVEKAKEEIRQMGQKIHAAWEGIL
jgi:hypothetical protein